MKALGAELIIFVGNIITNLSINNYYLISIIKFKHFDENN